MATTIEAQILRKLNEIHRDLLAFRRVSENWLTARETGMTKEQLRRYRQIHPERVKPRKESTRSYLYNIQQKAADNTADSSNRL